MKNGNIVSVVIQVNVEYGEEKRPVCHAHKFSEGELIKLLRDQRSIEEYIKYLTSVLRHN